METLGTKREKRKWSPSLITQAGSYNTMMSSFPEPDLSSHKGGDAKCRSYKRLGWRVVSQEKFWREKRDRRGLRRDGVRGTGKPNNTEEEEEGF